MARDTWDPAQYERFKDERARPLRDLLAMVKPAAGGRVVDLGCGTGEPTRELHARVKAAETLGIDRSEAMLAKAAAFAGAGVRFEVGEIGAFSGTGFDVVFSNAALHWVDDHPALLTRMARWVAPGGQLAVQVPANDDHPSHAAARVLAHASPWRERLGGYLRSSPVLAPERYAELLESMGAVEQEVRLQVYGHRLASREEVIEWVKGTLLTDYEARLSPEHYREFLGAYREQLFAAIPDRRPYFYTYKRILFWARMPQRPAPPPGTLRA